MSNFFSMKFFRCFAWIITGCYAMQTGVQTKFIALIVLGALSASLGFVLFDVFQDKTEKA